MKAIIIGAGKMGESIGYDLSLQDNVKKITFIDGCNLSSERLAKKIDKADWIVFPNEPLFKWEEVIKNYDVVISAATYEINVELTEATINAGVNLCDLGGNNTIVQKQLALNKKAMEKGITIIPDCGLAPGMANILAASIMDKFESVYECNIYVGGLPRDPVPPFNYKIIFNVDGLINEYNEPVIRVRNSKKEIVEPLTEIKLQAIKIGDDWKEFESFTTSGGLSTLADTYASKAINMEYKTIRYPGHGNIMAGLRSLGLFSDKIEVNPNGLVRSPLTRSLIKRLFSENKELNTPDKDMVIVKISVLSGDKKTRIISQIIDYYSDKTNHSAMQRMTGYPAAIIANMLGSGKITKKGVLPGELCVPFEEFISELNKRGITATEKIYNV